MRSNNAVKNNAVMNNSVINMVIKYHEGCLSRLLVRTRFDLVSDLVVRGEEDSWSAVGVVWGAASSPAVVQLHLDSM